MSEIHIVKQGEHLPGIAAANGFPSHKVLFDDPANAELKKLRPNPNILFPGDKVTFPDKDPKEIPKPTDKEHVFAVNLEKLKFRVKVLNLADEAFSGQIVLVLPNTFAEMEKKKDIHEADIGPLEKDAILQFEAAADKTQREDIVLEVGSLDPIKEQPGQRERLNNLAYFAGFSTTVDPDEFRWAVEEFQADHRDSDGLKVTGVCDEAKTQPALEKAYGM